MIGELIIRKARYALKRILHMASNLQPLRVKHIMASTAMSDHTCQSIPMGMGNAHSIMTATAHTPGDNLLCINPRLLMDPVQNTAPETIWGKRIIWISRAVSCAWNLNTNGRKSVGDVVCGGACVFSAVAIEAVDSHYDGKLVARFGANGETYAHRDGGVHFFSAGFG